MHPKKLSAYGAFMFALGFAWTWAGAEMMDHSMTGTFSGSGEHHASGNAKIDKGMDGHAKLVLTDLKVDRVPDGRVYLAKNGDRTKGVELGKLKKFSGTVEFAISDRIRYDDYNTVVIWCKKFDVEIGRAVLQSAMMDNENMMQDDGMMHDDGMMNNGGMMQGDGMMKNDGMMKDK